MSKLKKRILALGLSVVMVLAMIPMLGSIAFADESAADIDAVRTAIQALSTDPTSFKAEDKDSVEAIWKDFQALSEEDQAILDSDASSTSQPLGRILEAALWGVWSYDTIDNSTTLADGTYDASSNPALSSKYSKGKSTSKRDRPWSVKEVTVSGGKATATITVESETYSDIWMGGVKYPKTNESGNCEFANIPIDLNSTFYFAGVSTSMPTPIAFSLTTEIEEEEPPAEESEVIAIIHTNDVHGNIEVEPYVKGLADQMKATGDYSLVLTVSAGDVYSGGKAVAGYYNGELIPAIEDQVYDVIVPGNNDFPTGIPGNVLLSALYKNTKTICANIQVNDDTDVAAFAAAYQAKMGNADFADMYDGVEINEDGTLDVSALGLGVIEAGTSPWQKTLIIETEKGTKLGLFGLTCTDGQMAGMGKSQGTVNAAKESVAALKAEGAEAIVGIAHTGWMGEGSTDPAQVNDTNSWVVANEVQDMDALIDSHTHSIINDGNGCYVGDNKVLVNQASCFGDCIGIMYLYIKDGKVADKKAEVIREEAFSSIAPDKDVQATVDGALERIHSIAGDPLVASPYYLNGGTDITNEGGHVRGNETNMGDFLTDVLRAAASEKLGIDLAFSFIPGYCIRSSVEADVPFTNLEIASIFGMPLRLGAQKYTAEDVVNLVKNGLTAVNPSFGPKFIQMSGINVTYTNAFGRGIPVTIKVGDTLIYDSNKGGLQVDPDWSVTALRTLDPNDNVWEGSEDDLLCKNIEEVKELFHWYLESHKAEEGYKFYPNTIAPDGRIVEVPLSFNDVEDDVWFHDVVYDIARVVNQNGEALMSGYKDGSGNFGPADPLQRQDFAVILYRLADEPEFESAGAGFPDADPNGYYYMSAIWAQENKLITGYNDGRFGVGDNITREQVATILYRYAAFAGVDTETTKGDLSNFSDAADVSEFATDALTWANGAGIITGKEEGEDLKIDPQGNAARAEIGAMILRYLEFERKQESTDNNR